MDFTDNADQSVKKFARGSLKEWHRTHVIHALTLHDRVTGGVQPQHFRDKGRRMLAVTIHRYDDVRSGRVQACRQRGLMPEVPAEMNNPDSRIARGQLVQDCGSVVGRTVVYVNVAAQVSGRKVHGVEDFVKPG